MINFFAALAAAVQLISAGSLYPAALDVTEVTPDRVTFQAHSGHLYQTLDPEDDIILRVRYTR